MHAIGERVKTCCATANFQGLRELHVVSLLVQVDSLDRAALLRQKLLASLAASPDIKAVLGVTGSSACA